MPGTATHLCRTDSRGADRCFQTVLSYADTTELLPAVGP
jgi:hypothetical protein